MHNSPAAPLSRRVIMLCAVFTLQVIAVFAVNLREEPVALPDFSRVPGELGPWHEARTPPVDAGMLETLHPDEYVSRIYQDPARPTSINLFAAYFKSLKSSSGPHSPKVCLPGSGWKEINAHVSQVPLAAGGLIPVNDYVLEKDSQRILVMYWYQNKRHVWAQEFQAKLYTLPDLISHHRSDVAIVRLVAPIDSAGLEPALNTCRDFLREVYPALAARFAKT